MASDYLSCEVHSAGSHEPCEEKRILALRQLKELGLPKLTLGVIEKTDAFCPDGEPYKYHVYTNAYSFCCSGSNHSEYDVPPDYPKYDAINGLMERS